MGGSITVECLAGPDLDVALLRSAIARYGNLLLGQAGALEFDVSFWDGDGEFEVIKAFSGLTGSFTEKRYLGYGGFFSYGPAEFRNPGNTEDRFQFSLLEVRAKKDDLFLALCISIVTAVGEMVPGARVMDGWGSITSGDERLSVDDLLKYSVPAGLPLGQAMRRLYEHFPLSA